MRQTGCISKGCDRGVVLYMGFGDYRAGSVDGNTATRTQTLKWGREGRKVGREPNDNDQQTRENPQKLRDPAPTWGNLYQSP